MYVYMHILIYTYIYVYTYIHIHKHTHICIFFLVSIQYTNANACWHKNAFILQVNIHKTKSTHACKHTYAQCKHTYAHSSKLSYDIPIQIHLIKGKRHLSPS